MNLFDDTSQEQGQRLKGCDSSFSGPGDPPIPVSDWECVLGWTSAAPFSVLLTSYKNDSRYLILRAGNEGFKVIRCAGFCRYFGPPAAALWSPTFQASLLARPHQSAL